MDLNGVEKYKEYSRVVLDLIDVDLQQIKEVQEYLDYLSEQFRAAEAGQPVDSAAIAATTASFITRLNDLSPKVDELKKKAESLRKEL